MKRFALVVSLLLGTHCALCFAAELTIFPPEILLDGKNQSQSIVVQLTDQDGVSRDVTSLITCEILGEGDAIIASAEAGVLRPIRQGKGQPIAKFDDLTARIPITVLDAERVDPISFRRDVMPILMATGCNAGRCHGAARGQDGFHLSLFGYDAEGDYHSLTRELIGRRINFARPRASLLLTKATGEAMHTGGQRFQVGSDSYNTLLAWIEQGAKNDPPDIPIPVNISIGPTELTIIGENQTQQLVVQAHYSDGSRLDVTRQALYLSNNENVASIDSQGRITSGQRGEGFVMARFAAFTEGIPVIVLPRNAENQFNNPPALNQVDEIVYRKLAKLHLPAADVCTDQQFLRRVTIDLTGLTPTREEFTAFVADTDPDKRTKLVDRLLQSPSFVDVWTMRIGELLQIRTSNQVSYKALLGFHNWVREQIEAGRPLDEMLGDVISSTGGTFSVPATNFYQIEANALQLTENVAQSYLGMRIQCARCHNHPFDRWTMDDYYGFSAFFSQVGFKQSPDPREFIVYDRGDGEIPHFIPERKVVPRFLGDDAEVKEQLDRRVALADWIVSDENPAFARNIANIVWAHHFGQGIIDPVDDVRISNPPVNAELLEYVAQLLIANNYDLRALVREICTSRTYQLSTQGVTDLDGDVRNFARARVRRIRAEALLDSISQITETVDQFPRLPVGARASQIADGATSNYFLTTFGRAPRETVCACEVDVEPNLSQALQLINGDATNEKIVAGQVIHKLQAQGKSPEEVIEHLYILCFSRRPLAAEIQRLATSLDKSDPESGLQDIFWALLNSKEFLFNH